MEEQQQAVNGESGCLGCERITYQPVTLRTGKVVCSSCEAWRLECEARYVLAMPTKEARQAYLAELKDRAEPLKAEMMAIYEGGKRGSAEVHPDK